MKHVLTVAPLARGGCHLRSVFVWGDRLFIKPNTTQQEGGHRERGAVRRNKSTLERPRHHVWRGGCLRVRRGSWQVVRGCGATLTHHSVAHQRDWVLFCRRLVRPKKKNPHNDSGLQNVPPCSYHLHSRLFFSDGKVSGWGSLPGVCGAAEPCGAVNVMTPLWRSDNPPVCLSTQGKCSGILNVAQ